jgi:predicted peptidase
VSSSRFCFFLLLVLVFTLGSPALARKHETGFLDRTLSIRGVTYKYQVFVPDHWSSNQRWPIILFLHGAGERGTDGLIQTQVGIATAIRNDRSRFPAIVVLPQCPKEHSWNKPDMEEVALAALAAASKEFKGDRKRTYLTGLSMGGYGSWALAAAYPHKFAAVVPICGGILPPDDARKQADSDRIPYLEAAKKIGTKLPIWVFHGDADPDVPVSESRHMVEALKAAGADVRYTEYPGVGHKSWDKAYADPELMTWLLSKSL